MKNQFEENYFNEIFQGFEIDGNFNSKFHVNYILSYFALFEKKIKSILEIGFGNGKILEELVKKINLDKIIALEISKLKINELSQKKYFQNENIAIVHSDFLDYKTDYLEKIPIDLSICNSVLQYVETENLENFVQKIARISRYSYLTVPTKKDFEIMKSKLNFIDRFALQRPKSFYKKILKKYFRVVGTNLLESKIIVSESILKQELYLEEK